MSLASATGNPIWISGLTQQSVKSSLRFGTVLDRLSEASESSNVSKSAFYGVYKTLLGPGYLNCDPTIIRSGRRRGRPYTVGLHTSLGGGQFRHPDFPKSLGNPGNP